MALLDMAQQYLGQNEVAQISQQLGIDPNVAQTARTAIGCNKAFEWPRSGKGEEAPDDAVANRARRARTQAVRRSEGHTSGPWPTGGCTPTRSTSGAAAIAAFGRSVGSNPRRRRVSRRLTTRYGAIR